YDWLKTTVGSLLPKSPVAGAIGYLLNRWDSFTRYCSQGVLSIDNNLCDLLPNVWLKTHPESRRLQRHR
ncbi:hypothetical protein MNBD_PLANCTO02-791, partial [hydrothermal vent metagenome]